MPSEGLRLGRDSGSILCDTLKKWRFRTGWGGVNKPLWYMSVLFVGGTIVYSIIYCTKKVAINLLIPLIFILGYTYLFHNSTSNTIESWDIDGCISNPLIRGICDISLGTIIGYFICEKKESICKHSFSISVYSIVSFLVAVFLCFMNIHSTIYHL